MLAGTHPLTSMFVGIAGYAPASFHDLVDDEVESDGSSIGDVMAPGHPLSQEPNESLRDYIHRF